MTAPIKKGSRLASDDLGEFGENRISAFCAAAGIATTRVGRDKHGWDLLFEVPVPRTKPQLGFGETDPPIRTCKVQVKTSHGGERVPPAKLSNWAIMARDPNPWFIVHVVVEKKRVREIRIAHIGKDLVEAALKRVFLAEHAGKELNRHLWRCSSKHFRSIPRSSSGLLKAIQSVLGESSASYVTAKQKWRDEAGYTLGRFTFRFSTRSDPSVPAAAKLAMFLTGELDSLAPDTVSLVETRFGVNRPIAMGGPKAAHTLHVPKPPSTGISKVSVLRRSTGDIVTFDCETHIASSVIPGLPDRQQRARFAAKGFSLICAPNGEGEPEAKLQVTLPARDESVILDSAVRRSSALALLCASSGDAFVEVTLTGAGTFSFDAPAMVSSPEECQFANVLQAVGRVCEAFKISMDFDVIPSTFMASARDWWLLGVGVSNRSAEVHSISFGKVSPAPVDAVGKRGAFLVRRRFQIGTYHIAATVCIEGTVRASLAGAIDLERARVRVLSRYRTVDAPTPWETLLSDCEQERAKLLAEGFAIAAMDTLEQVDEVSPLKRSKAKASRKGSTSRSVPRTRAPSPPTQRKRRPPPQ